MGLICALDALSWLVRAEDLVEHWIGRNPILSTWQQYLTKNLDTMAYKWKLNSCHGYVHSINNFLIMSMTQTSSQKSRWLILQFVKSVPCKTPRQYGTAALHFVSFHFSSSSTSLAFAALLNTMYIVWPDGFFTYNTAYEELVIAPCLNWILPHSHLVFTAVHIYAKSEC